jgi:hypothetical protein
MKHPSDYISSSSEEDFHSIPVWVTNSGLFNNYYLEHQLLSEEFDTFPARLCTAFEEYSALMETLTCENLRNFENNEEDCKEELIRRLLFILGHSDNFHRTRSVGRTLEGVGSKTGTRPDILLTKVSRTGETPGKSELENDLLVVVECKRMGINFDYGSSRTPATQICTYVMYNKVSYGFLTDGRRWRLYIQQNGDPLTCSEYFQVDLPLLDEPAMTLQDFAWFYNFFSRESFVSVDARTGRMRESFIQKVIRQKHEYVTGVRTFIANNSRTALRSFRDILDSALKHDTYVSDVWNRGRITETIHHVASKYMIRIMYILMAEGRGILPLENEAYRNGYSVTELIRKIRDEQLSTGEVQENVWFRLCATFQLLREPAEFIGIVPKHSIELFAKDTTWEEACSDFFSTCGVENDLKKFLTNLGRSKDIFRSEGGLIDFSAFSPRDIGDMYQTILAVTDEDVTENKVRRLDQLEQCSFYTPHWAVRYMVHKTLNGLVPEEIEDPEYIDRMFALRIIDPAMGSGHFLVEVINQLTKRIMKAHNYGGESRIMKQFSEGGSVGPEMWIRTRVATHCIYGIDKNPIATDLAKCAILLTCGRGANIGTILESRGLDSHLVCGDSILGCASLRDLLTPALCALDFVGFVSLEELVEVLFADKKFRELKLLACARMLVRNDKLPLLPLLVDALTSEKDLTLGFALQELRNSGLNRPLESAVQWMLQFVELIDPEDIWAPPQFDAVITNPPWLTLSQTTSTSTPEMNLYKKEARSLVKHSSLYAADPKCTVNLYVPFLERSIAVLRMDRGRLGFLVQASVLSSRDASTNNSLLYQLTQRETFTSFIEFPKKSLFKDVNKPCIIFTLETRDDPLGLGDRAWFPYRRVSRSEMDTISTLHTLGPWMQARFNPNGFLIKNIVFPSAIPDAILCLQDAYLCDLDPSPWNKYSDFCNLTTGTKVCGPKAKKIREANRTPVCAQPVFEGKRIIPFKHHTRNDPTWWMPPKIGSSTCCVRLFSREVGDFHSERRLKAGVGVDTREGEKVMGDHHVHIHDFGAFGGRPILKQIPGLTEQDITWIFCCLMNSKLLEFLFRSFDYTDCMTTSKVSVFPVPNLHNAVISSTSLTWDVFSERVFDNDDCVMLSADYMLSTLGIHSLVPEEYMGSLLVCLALIGRNMPTPMNERHINIMDCMVNALYGLSLDDREYLDLFFEFCANYK